MTRVTLRTVARRVGVSPMTVSNAFSRPDQLTAALREKILAAAAELGYAGPDPAARTLARGSTGTVGILFPARPATPCPTISPPVSWRSSPRSWAAAGSP